MLRTPFLTLPLTEPLAFLDATLLFVIQLLIARHPELLAVAEPDSSEPPISRLGVRHERRVFDAVRELHIALDSYRIFVSDDMPYPDSSASTATDDNIPF